MSFTKLKERLREEGWYVGWNHYCCQSCAWMDVPDKFEDGTEVDLSKVLFNHSQDCEVDCDYERCEACDGQGYDEETDTECPECEQLGEVRKYMEDISECDHQHAPGFVCYHPHQVGGSLFCFDGSKKGVKNLKAILPIIEECGCSWNWTQKGDHRIEIGW